MAFKLRAANESDHDFLYAVIREAFREVAERQYGSWEDLDQRRRFFSKLRRVAYRIIDVNGMPVGLVAATVHEDHVFLDDLAILPEHQNQGIGSAVLLSEVRAAHAIAKPLRLHTPRVNRALSFYARRGFVETGRDEGFVNLERAAQQPVATDERAPSPRSVARSQQNR
jgi:ribosomal protein S18 acetylase RimI-like enzyme